MNLEKGRGQLPRFILNGATGMSFPIPQGPRKSLGLLDAEIVSKEKTPQCYFGAEMAF